MPRAVKDCQLERLADLQLLRGAVGSLLPDPAAGDPRALAENPDENRAGIRHFDWRHGSCARLGVW
eukprot:8543670-Pyramimonas_sp.AAC.1